MTGKTAYIIIDSGFSTEALARAKNVLAVYDLPGDSASVGEPLVAAHSLAAFAGDNCGNHGSEVLNLLLDRVPDGNLVLIRCIDADQRIIRTGWTDGRRSRKGWVDAYVEAVELCRTRGYCTVANCSFGGYTHAMDGTGWEAHCIGQVTGPGRRGHIMVAAAGSGDGRADHSSVLALSGEESITRAFQEGDTLYNFWAKDTCRWELTVLRDSTKLFTVSSDQVPANIWNGQRQQTFVVPGQGLVKLIVSVHQEAGVRGTPTAKRFDCWVEGNSSFLNNIDPLTVVEPACFPTVVAVGLRLRKYNPRQAHLKEKPDVLLASTGPISFRLPEVTAAVGRLLEHDPNLDINGVRGLLGKYPDPDGF